MDRQKRTTPERKQPSLTEDTLGKPIPKSLMLTLGMKALFEDVFLS